MAERGESTFGSHLSLGEMLLAALRLARRTVWSVNLVALGLVDATYCSAQLGRRLGVWRSAWAVTSGDRTISPHPLIEPDWIMWVRVGIHGSWLSAFWRRSSGLTSVGPALELPPGSAPAAWRCFRVLRRLASGSVVPAAASGAGGADRREVEEIAHSSALEAVEQSRRNRSRSSQQWVAADERKFWEDHAKHPLVIGERTVSVIMAVRNGEESVGAAVRSVLAQTWQEWHLIVVDDGSTDGTVAAAATAAAGDARISIVSQDPRGVGAARNQGLAHAEGVFVAFLDADNEWRPGFLSGVVSSLVRSGVDLAFSAVAVHGDQDTRYLGGSASYAELRDGSNVIDLNAMITTRDAIEKAGRFNERLARWVDFDLVLRILQEGEAVYCPFLGVDYDHRSSRSDRITTRESANWREVVLLPHFADVRSEARDRLEHRLSAIVVSRRGDEPELVETIGSILDNAGAQDTEVVVVETSSSSAAARIVRVAFASAPVRVVRMARDHGYALPANVGFLSSAGSLVAFIEPGTRFESTSLERFAARFDDPAVLGVRSRPSGVGRGAAPSEQVVRAPGLPEAGAVTSCLLVRASDFRIVGGFDPRFPAESCGIDLFRRLTLERDGSLVDIEEAVESRPSLGRNLSTEADLRLASAAWRESRPTSWS